MNEILHANIFFFIASAATVCFCILVSIALYHVIKILQIIRVILTRVEEGSEVLAEDLAHIREVIAEGGIMSRLFGLFFGGAKAKPAASKRRRKVINRNSSFYGNKEESGEEGDKSDQ